MVLMFRACGAGRIPGVPAPGYSGKAVLPGVTSQMALHADLAILGPSRGRISEEKGVLPQSHQQGSCLEHFSIFRGKSEPPPLPEQEFSLQQEVAQPPPGQALGQEVSPLQGKSLDHWAARVSPLSGCASAVPPTPPSAQMGRPPSLHPLGPTQSGLIRGCFPTLPPTGTQDNVPQHFWSS